MNVVLIGSGNIAGHLGRALVKNGHRVIQVFGRNQKSVFALAKKLHSSAITDPERINKKADLYLLAVPDREIKKAAAVIPVNDRTVAHTSGSVNLKILPARFKHAGVLYPLQTMTTGSVLDYSKIPFCIEGRSALALKQLKRFASGISEKVIELDSAERAWLHLAAVLVNNLPNHLFSLAHRLMDKKGLDFDLLRPLILETAKKVMHADPFDMQTGPARRGDSAVLEKHLRMLQREPRIAAIYSLLSESIEDLHGPRL